MKALGALHRACSVLFHNGQAHVKETFSESRALGRQSPVEAIHSHILSAGGEDPSLVRRSIPEHLVHT